MTLSSPGWREASLGEICIFKYGKALPQTSRSGGEFPVYGSNGVVGHHDSAITSGQTVVIGRKGSYGEVNFSECPCWPIDTAYFVDETATEQNIRWLSYRIANLGLNQLNKAAAVPGLNRDDAYRQRLLVPPLPEQHRIAAILDQADALRAKRREALAQLDSLEDSIFSDFQARTASTSHEASLNDLSERTRGSFVNGPFGSDLLTSELQNEGVPVVYIRDIRNGDYQRVSKSCVSERKAKDLAVCSVHAGDVLVAKVGDPPGVAAVYPSGEPKAVVTQDVIRIRPNLEVALPEFIKAYLNSSIGRWKIAAITVEATRARVSLGDFKRLTVEVPSLELQREFLRRIDGLKVLRNFNTSSLAKLDSLFASLQHRAFRDEL